MAPDEFVCERFPRSAKYHPDWVRRSVSGGANSLWLAEWLTEALPLRPGLRVLDLGCGRAASSIFLHREFGVQTWAVDLWFSPSENLQRIRAAGVEDGVFPLRGDARGLPFADEFFDVIVCIDSHMYFGTDDHALNDLVRFVKPGGALGIAGAGLMEEIGETVPEHLRPWWEPGCWSLHSAAWWRRHWERTGLVDVEQADTLPEGWQYWLRWHRAVCPENTIEMTALEADQGRHLGYVRQVARRRADAVPAAPITSLPSHYEPAPLLRTTD